MEKIWILQGGMTHQLNFLGKKIHEWVFSTQSHLQNLLMGRVLY